MRSVLHLETTLKGVVSNNRQHLTNKDASARQKALVKVVEDRAFWSDLAVLTPHAEPFNKVCFCRQLTFKVSGRVVGYCADTSLCTCAGVCSNAEPQVYIGRLCTILYILAKTLKKAEENQSQHDRDFLAHAFTVFNRRWAVQATIVTRLALFLHPGYRVLSNRDGEWKELKMKVSLCSVARTCFVLICCMWHMHDWLHALHVLSTSVISCSKQGLQMILQAMDLCVGRQWGEEKMRHLFEQMDAYKANTQDYQRSLTLGADPDEWWQVVGRNLTPEADQTPAIISVFARLLLCVVPHAADPERIFSAMGLDHSPLRNRFNEDTASKMGLVRSHNRVSPPEEE